jgi:hypothetical protein
MGDHAINDHLHQGNWDGLPEAIIAPALHSKETDAQLRKQGR